MAPRLEFTVLDVDQGSGNLVEVYDATNDKVPQHVVLIDLGSHIAHDRAGPRDAVTFVVDRLKSMNPPTLDGVFLSHSDVDHISLIRWVLKHFDPPGGGGTTLTVKGVWYGGAKEKYGKGKKKFNVLDELDKYRPPSITTTVLNPLEADESSYGMKKSLWEPKWHGGGAEAWLVHANAVSERGAGVLPKRGSYALNAVSLIVMLTYADHRLVATGDATGLTLRRCNKLIDDVGPLLKLAPVFTLTIPHHGSKDTLDVTNALTPTKYQPGELRKKTMEKFVENFKPQTISASAGENSYHHPDDSVIQSFATFLAKDVWFKDPVLLAHNLDQHFYTAYFAPFTVDVKPPSGAASGATVSKTWPPEAYWYTVRTNKNIFTTDYYRRDQKTPDFIVHPAHDAVDLNTDVFSGTIHRATGWQFTVTATGGRDIKPVVPRPDGPTPLAESAEAAARQARAAARGRVLRRRHAPIRTPPRPGAPRLAPLL